MILTIFFWLGFVLYILASAVLILVVLVQSGKGGGLSGLVGAGSAIGDHLGATGAEKTLTRWTTYCAIGFLILNVFLVLAGGKIFKGRSITDQLPPPAAASQQMPPAAPNAMPGIPGPATPTTELPAAPAAPAASLPASAPPAAPVAPAQPPAAPPAAQ